MLHKPDRSWVLRDFTVPGGVSLGLAQAVISEMEKQGYVTWVKRGVGSSLKMSAKDNILSAWVRAYDFYQNFIYTYYNPDKKFLQKLKSVLKPEQYALTVHSGANLLTSYVRSDDIHLYLNENLWDKELLKLRQKLELKELANGGNVHIIRSYYKSNVFLHKQMIRGFPVVANLQLYLDLYNFQPRGREHADFLKETLNERGDGVG
ncbi:MAG: hypothetical protein JW969_08590 [Spirochaetales bacterium]|nr:hypothetical protein [Spirochaetales bacterium]